MKKIYLNGGIDAYTRFDVGSQLRASKNEEVTLVINSMGGLVNEGIAISQMVTEHGNVTAEIIGFVASAATLVALGAKKVLMHENSMWLAHKCMITTDVYGDLNADDLANVIDDLQKQKKMQEAVDLNIAGMYLSAANHKGKSMRDVAKMMQDATWMSAEDCLAWGFVHEVVKDSVKRGQVSDELALVIKNMGMPPVPEAAVINTLVENSQSEEPSWINSFINKVTAIFSQQPKNDSEVIKQLKNDLNEKATLILNLQGVQAKHMKVVAALDELGDDIKAEEDAIKKVELIKDLIAQIPVGLVKPNHVNDKTDLSDVAKDDINNYTGE